jgi:hypothetical protein
MLNSHPDRFLLRAESVYCLGVEFMSEKTTIYGLRKNEITELISGVFRQFFLGVGYVVMCLIFVYVSYTSLAPSTRLVTTADCYLFMVCYEPTA